MVVEKIQRVVGGKAERDDAKDRWAEVGPWRHVYERTRPFVHLSQDRSHGLPFVASKMLLEPFWKTLENVDICQVGRGFDWSFVFFLTKEDWNHRLSPFAESLVTVLIHFCC